MAEDLPSPPKDETAGYHYELSILAAGFSLTQMIVRPVSGRILFEQGLVFDPAAKINNTKVG